MPTVTHPLDQLPEEYRISKKDAGSRLRVAPITINRAIGRGRLHKFVSENGYNVMLDVRQVDEMPVWRPVAGARV
ncbi:MAG: hypothetical protein JWQ03_3212 [Variovorax sp.]|nr:hypothetical protein [Variovorax sp.]